MSSENYKNIKAAFEKHRRLPRLSPRLRHVSDLVKPCNRLIDIGCDHGYLGIVMVAEGLAREAVMTDINQKPYEDALHLVRAFDLQDKIKVFWADGLGKVELQPDDTIVILGIGAFEIRSILMSISNKEKYSIYLQPTWNREVLRNYLAAEGFLMEESLCKDNIKVYSTFTLKSGHKRKLTLVEASVGESWLIESPIYQAYKSQQPQLLLEWLKYLKRVYQKKQLNLPEYAEVAEYLESLCVDTTLAL